VDLTTGRNERAGKEGTKRKRERLMRQEMRRK
jgi:hypothetical protein